MAEAPNACEKNYLLELAQYLDDQGFGGDEVREYVTSEAARSEWNSAVEFLGALSRDVWWHYGHVGDEDERYIYEEAEDAYNKYAEKVRRCRTRSGWSGARRRR